MVLRVSFLNKLKHTQVQQTILHGGIVVLCALYSKQTCTCTTITNLLTHANVRGINTLKETSRFRYHDLPKLNPDVPGGCELG